MQIVISLIIGLVFAFAGLVCLILVLLKRKPIRIAVMFGAFAVAIGAFVFTIYEGNRFARDYNDGPNEYINAIKPSYSVCLNRENKSEDGNSSLPLGVYMRVTDYDAYEQTLTVDISNQSGYEMAYGDEYSLQILEDEEWVDIEPTKEYGWHDIVHILPNLETAEEVYDISMFGKLDEGTYRLCKTDLFAEFTLYREWTE